MKLPILIQLLVLSATSSTQAGIWTGIWQGELRDHPCRYISFHIKDTTETFSVYNQKLTGCDGELPYQSVDDILVKKEGLNGTIRDNFIKFSHGPNPPSMVAQGHPNRDPITVFGLVGFRHGVRTAWHGDARNYPIFCESGVNSRIMFTVDRADDESFQNLLEYLARHQRAIYVIESHGQHRVMIAANCKLTSGFAQQRGIVDFQVLPLPPANE